MLCRSVSAVARQEGVTAPDWYFGSMLDICYDWPSLDIHDVYTSLVHCDGLDCGTQKECWDANLNIISLGILPRCTPQAPNPLCIHHSSSLLPY